MQQQPHRLRNRDLDRLGQHWDRYKQAVRHADMLHGEHGMGMEERARKIGALVQELAELTPQRAQRIGIDPGNPDISAVVADVHAARQAILPRRRSHEPKKKYAINDESREHIAFCREFVDQWQGPQRDYMQQHFPHLYHAAESLRQYVALYDFTQLLEQDYNRATLIEPLSPQKRSDVLADLTVRRDAMLSQWPQMLASDEYARDYLPQNEAKRFDDAIRHGRCGLLRLPSSANPDRTDTLSELQRSMDALRYEACAAAHRSFTLISCAYRADRKDLIMNRPLLDTHDPLQEDLPMLDRVYHARWALLADVVGELVKSNEKMLRKHGMLPPQSRAEAFQQQRADCAGSRELFD